ncbi:hypothetical protein LOTGIDRAFT_239387 [Lottia gigantea]|uniref:PAS domain-containing protein n=1 Tax=Lottia gigantea TaxID=225164 RepID=V4AQG7_LOTGI|nr:hypothetical protein LOTGIDRAFT_239387 [Lottia gigantea]ESO95906.1 hypothetical protein LOTGIDRAFT_239387 [Lottia gigantea]
MGCMAILRILRADGSVIWINMVMHVRQAAVASNDEPVIVCINQVVSEQEAYQFKLQSNSFSIYPSRTGDLWTHGVGNIQTQPQTTQWMPNTSNFGQFSTLRHSQPGFPEQMNQQNYMSHRRGRPAQPSTATSIHTEKVKQMLQKKITSQCKPAKIPRTDRTEKPETFHGEFGLGISSNFFFGSFEPFNDASLSFEPFGQSNTQVMSVNNYAVSSSPSLTKKNVMVEPRMMNQSSCLSPNLQLEQVVPDPCLQIPESFLTPEASPASSPEHKSSSDGNASIDNSFDILEDLSKIQQFREVERNEKTEKTGMKRKRKGLPFIDPLDIESFFDELIPGEKKVAPPKPMIKLEKKPSLPDLDSDDLEEFLNWIDVKPCSLPQPPVMCIKQEPIEVPLMAANSCYRSQYTSTQSMQSQSPHHSVPSPVSTISEVFSPGPCYSSELSEEELLDELNSSPMALTVDVGTIRDEFEALQQAHFPGDPMPEESELNHLHRLLKELVPSSGSRSLIKDSQ